MTTLASIRRAAPALVGIVPALLSQAALAQGFDKINTTVTNVNTILVTISIAVVTIVDNDTPGGKLNFSLAAFGALEGAGQAVITVTRSGSSANRRRINSSDAGPIWSGKEYQGTKYWPPGPGRNFNGVPVSGILERNRNKCLMQINRQMTPARIMQ